jgi:hypothetical protein
MRATFKGSLALKNLRSGGNEPLPCLPHAAGDILPKADEAERVQRSTLTTAGDPKGRSHETRTLPASDNWWHHELFWFVPLAAISTCAYFLYTRQIQEDFFITFRCSRNLVQGHGLVYNLGERVHGFTSPLGVLLPALCDWVWGARSYVTSLLSFRILSIAAYVTGGMLVLRSLKGPQAMLERIFFGCFYILDSKTVAFTTNGMETGFMLLFLGWAIYLLQSEGHDPWLQRGCCWAGLMWTRPDGCIYIAALGLSQLLFQPQKKGRLLASLAKSGLVCAIMYLPWFTWASWYYGSPVPQTIIAKSGWESSFPSLLQGFTEKALARWGSFYSPNHYLFGGWSPWIGNWSLALCVFAAIYWLFPIQDPLGRMVSLCFLLSSAYLFLIPFLCAWYIPPAALLGFVAAVRGLPRVTRLAFGSAAWGKLTAYGMLTACVAIMAYLSGLGMWRTKLEQETVNEARTSIGLWLNAHVRPADRVYVEPLGYIGYFSEATMLDFPGLVTPRVVELRKKDMTLTTIPLVLRPEWMVLRDSEARRMASSGFLDREYSCAKVFDVRGEIRRHEPVPGENMLLFDGAYFIFKKK